VSAEVDERSWRARVQERVATSVTKIDRGSESSVIAELLQIDMYRRY
jgi:hypothetical protein